MLSIKKIILTFTALICCLALAACGVNKTINQKYFPDAEFNTLIVSADAAMGRADWAKAISAYEEGIALKPKNTDIKLKLANAYERDGKLAQAFNTYQLILDDSQSTAETLKLVKSKQDKLGFKKDPIVPVVIDNPQSKQVTPVTELVIAPAQDVKDVPTTETPEPLPSKQVNIVEMEAEVTTFPVTFTLIDLKERATNISIKMRLGSTLWTTKLLNRWLLQKTWWMLPSF
jgi:tetratricopeptide (TPR) repeat protein